MNMDSFSLYNRAGFVPRVTYHDMVINVPTEGLAGVNAGENENIRDAVIADIEKMGNLEMEISGIRRDIDYRYAIENPHVEVHLKEVWGHFPGFKRISMPNFLPETG